MKDCEPPDLVYRVAVAADAVVHIVFEKLAELNLTQSGRIAARIKDETGQLSDAPRLLYDFREVATWDQRVLVRLTGLFAALASHSETRGAFLAASDAQFIDLYTVCVLRAEGHREARAVFRSETAALVWLCGSD